MIVAVFALLAVGPSLQYTVTQLFSDRAYTAMTLDVARATLALAKTTDTRRVRVGVLDNTSCAAFAPYECLTVGAPSRAYFDMISPRLAHVIDLLRQPPPNVTGVFVLDSDVALRRNVADRLAAYGADLVFQRELPCAERRCVNGGVWWARVGSEGALATLEFAAHLMKTHNLPDQDALQVAIGAELATIAFLPIRKYPNGLVHMVNTQLLARNVHLVHANWCPSDKKQARLDAVTFGRGRWLARPPDVNQSFVCEMLSQLSPEDASASLGCTSASRCRRRIALSC